MNDDYKRIIRNYTEEVLFNLFSDISENLSGSSIPYHEVGEFLQEWGLENEWWKWLAEG